MTIVARVLIGPIRAYQRWISPLLPRHCRYEPTCSQFMVEAITKHGPMRGLGMGIRRIGRCHPWSQGGFDPVPDAHPRRAV